MESLSVKFCKKLKRKVRNMEIIKGLFYQHTPNHKHKYTQIHTNTHKQTNAYLTTNTKTKRQIKMRKNRRFKLIQNLIPQYSFILLLPCPLSSLSRSRMIEGSERALRERERVIFLFGIFFFFEDLSNKVFLDFGFFLFWLLLLLLELELKLLLLNLLNIFLVILVL